MDVPTQHKIITSNTKLFENETLLHLIRIRELGQSARK